MPNKGNDEIFIGMVFANNWKILKKFTPKEYGEILFQNTGIKKNLHNAYYLCKNLECGVETYIERTQIRRALGRAATCLNQCKTCNPNTCYYKNLFRTYNAASVIDRTPKVKPGDTNGFFTVERVIPTTESNLPQITLGCKCNFCGAKKVLFMHHYEHKNHTCDCMREGSMGESYISTYLKEHGISFVREYTFEGLLGDGNGKLRYDFAFMRDNKVIGLLEFDGQQHFETGGLYNPEGKVQIHDEYKNNYAKEHDIPLLRVPYNQIDKFEILLRIFIKHFKVKTANMLTNTSM